MLPVLGLTTNGLAQELSMSHQPELERDEARRMIPDPSQLNEITVDEINIPYRAQRKRQRGLSEILTPGKSGDPLLRIQPLEGYLDYDEEDQIIYGPSRTRLTYGEILVEADKLILDARLQEIQAEGNVILKMDESEIFGDSLRFNYGANEGVAFNARGSTPPVYFSSVFEPGDKRLKEPQLLKVSQEESIFRNTRATSCDFKTPHYFIRGREIILFDNDRIFFRNATLHVWGVPAFYLPVYSRSLGESSPWFFKIGTGSRTGTRARMGYEYNHRIEEPGLEDEEDMITRTSGNAQVFLDYLSKLGKGGGFNYQYSVEFDRHQGELRVYGLHDNHRRVVGENMSETNLMDESSRWAVNWKHRSLVADDMVLIINVDEFSDPDIFHDVLDLWSDDDSDRERLVERESKVALTLNKDVWVMRIMAQMRDRIGIDRVNDFSDPRDDNRDFDLDPYSSLKNADSDGISDERWGHVSRKLPQITAATSWLKPGQGPLYYSSEVHLYNSLDKGINIISDDDDGFVKGVETYHSLLHQWKLAQRYVLLAKVGAGAGGAERDKDLGLDFPGGTTFPVMMNALTFVDPDTWQTGRTKNSLDDLENAYSWVDGSLQLNARFSDALKGFLRWRYRHTTDDFIGDFYSSQGDLTVRHDLFNYKIREHWVDYNLVYRLLHPIITLYTRGGINLLGDNHLYSKEPVARILTGSTWSNPRRTLSTNLYVGGTRTQTYDPTDPRQYTEERLLAGVEVAMNPIHNRWYSLMRVALDNVRDSRTERSSDSNQTFFTDEDRDVTVDFIFGRELGPKWNTEVGVEWADEKGGLDEITWKLERDMHDAIGVLRVSVERDELDSRRREDNSDTELDVQFGIKLKLAAQEIDVGQGRSSVLASKTREPSLAY
jgi:hypothetical protein